MLYIVVAIPQKNRAIIVVSSTFFSLGPLNSKFMLLIRKWLKVILKVFIWWTVTKTRDNCPNYRGFLNYIDLTSQLSSPIDSSFCWAIAWTVHDLRVYRDGIDYQSHANYTIDRLNLQLNECHFA